MERQTEGERRAAKMETDRRWRRYEEENQAARDRSGRLERELIGLKRKMRRQEDEHEKLYREKRRRVDRERKESVASKRKEREERVEGERKERVEREICERVRMEEPERQRIREEKGKSKVKNKKGVSG